MSRLLILLLVLAGCSESPETRDVEQVDLSAPNADWFIDRPSAGVISIGPCGGADGTIAVDDDKRILWH